MTRQPPDTPASRDCARDPDDASTRPGRRAQLRGHIARRHLARAPDPSAHRDVPVDAPQCQLMLKSRCITSWLPTRS